MPPRCANDDQALGRAVARLRVQRDQPDRDTFAAAAGIEPDVLAALETGARGATWRELVAIADGLGMTLTHVAQAIEAEMARTKDR
jgi:hypothetical protein